MNATITVRLMKVNDTALEISRDGGCNLTLGLKGSEVLVISLNHNSQQVVSFLFALESLL